MSGSAVVCWFSRFFGAFLAGFSNSFLKSANFYRATHKATFMEDKYKDYVCYIPVHANYSQVNCLTDPDLDFDQIKIPFAGTT
jgi:hypothetical protein